ncbi:RNA polymerase sigma factor [Phaeobacter sp. PT47_59]|uniref:RNA polymerase sigma factor n=1 Tax=Phaeobacter sp. PT47_59 TaxID=3029979 RepID=UPI00238048EE|nr:RNA polymerase sigma factor [Phaeobacter sp. PT47_59]MDE4174867.1 RNA polymerase sigma factor [Phaeobacter sp. PT47_59]
MIDASLKRPGSDETYDTTLLARVAQGDMVAMKALYMAHADAATRFVRARVRDDAEAADIVHDTMLSVWQGAAGFQGRANVRSWILSIARNKVVDHIRKQSRMTFAAPDEDIPDGDPDPEAVLAASQDAARMRACVGALPERQRAVIHLAFFEDLPLSEVAEVEAVPVGTVKSRIHHAKQMLMRCLSKGGLK